MKLDLRFYSFLILALMHLLFGGCQLSTPASRAQKPTAVTTQKSVALSQHGGSDKEQPPTIKLLPIDEGSANSSFQNFRNQLLNAVENRDKDFVIGVLDPDIKNGYDIEQGINEFRKRWNLEDPESSLWDVLSRILRGGGSFKNRQTEFCGPYVISQWPNVVRQLPEGSDTLDYVAITGKDIDVRRDAHLTSPIIATLSYDIVRTIPDSQVIDRSLPTASSWVKIKTPAGPEGFVLDNVIQGPMDYGACFSRRNGNWAMSELAASE
jgi:hypothetical protein